MPQGHPDGQNYAVWRGPDFLAGASVHVDSTHPVTVQGQTTNFASLFVQCKPIFAAGVSVLIEFYLDSSLTTPVLGYTYILPNGVSLAVLLPCISNFVNINVTTGDPVGGNVGFVALPTNTPVSEPSYQGTLSRLASGTVSVPSASSVGLLLPSVAAGDYTWFITDTGSSGKLSFTLSVANQDSTAGATIDLEPAPVTHLTKTFSLDEEPLLVTIANSDAVAHNAITFLACNARGG